MKTEHQSAVDTLMKVDADLAKKNPEKLMKRKEKQMNAAAKMLDFETAAILRDEIKQLEEIINKDKKDKEKEKATKKRSKFK